MTRLLEQLRQTLPASQMTEASDPQLLELFVKEADPQAFRELVRRHGSLVMGVCRRMLRHHQDAEDAFQAVFLVLAKRAASVHPRGTLSSWLYGVAWRVASKARTLRHKRNQRETLTSEPPARLTHADEEMDEYKSVLDEELRQLPEKYRLPILLCELQGKTRPAVAELLGWPEGTVAGRLHRGKKMLAKRLTRRGIVLSVPGLASIFAEESMASVSAAETAAAVRVSYLFSLGESPMMFSEAVLNLSRGALQTMTPNRWNLMIAILCIVGLVCGLGYFTQVFAQNSQSSTNKGRQESSANTKAGLETNPISLNQDGDESEANEEEETYEQVVNLRKIPKKVKAAGLKAVQNMTNARVKLTKAVVEANLIYELEGKVNGKEVEILITGEGHVVREPAKEKGNNQCDDDDDEDEAERELDIPLTAVPNHVVKAAKKAYRGIKLSEASVMSVLVYEFQAAAADLRFEVEVTAAGKVLEIEGGQDED
ncbi:MAG: sigma-70 family RNA polymerase sigma factor [Gemmataceae bacterium]